MPWIRTIVDERDRVVGYKDSSQINHPADIYRVSALWLTNSSGKVLLAQRGLSLKNSPGKWGPAVAGTVDKGETYQTNIRKEAEEEIGLTAVRLRPGPKRLVREPGRSYFCQWYTACVDMNLNDFTPDVREVASLKWVQYKALVKDVQCNPENYIPEFGGEVALFDPGRSQS
jgi:isopentenyl-diphosphate delta-isomerase